MKEYNPVHFLKTKIEKEIDSNILLHGKETFFHDEIQNRISDRIFANKSEKDLNAEIFYGPEANYLQVLSSCSAFPMMSRFKLVVVKQFEKLKIDNKDAFFNYLKNPQKSTILILSAENLPRTRLYKDIMQYVTSVNCKPLGDQTVFTWVQSRFKENNIEVPSDALAFLIQNTGTDLIRLKIEIEKIINFIKPEKTIGLDQISEITGFSREFDIFALQKALAKKDLQHSLKIGLSLLEHGVNLAAIFPVIFLFINKIWIVKSLQNKGMNKSQILREVNGPEFQWRDALNAAENFKPEDTDRIMENLLHADFRLKSSQQSEVSLLSLLLFHICSK